MSFVVHPTYRSGFASPKRIGGGLTFRNPSLWRGCVGAWCPSLGATGSVLFDHSGNGLNGTPTVMDAATDWVASDGQLALDFDGTNDYVNVGINTRHATSVMSISLWVKSNVTPAQYDGIISKTGGGGGWDEGWGFFWNSTTHIVFFGGDYALNASTGTVTPTVWNHIVGVANGVNVTLWINGSPQTSGTQGATITRDANFNSLEFGRMGLDAYNLNGQLDDIRIYNRELKPSEILALRQRRGIAYEAYRGVSCVSAAPAKLPSSVIINQAVMHASNF